jgi:hypothetical protein
MIESYLDLKSFFVKTRNSNTDTIFVSSKIRKDWLLNHETVIVKGTRREITFKNMKGGVWQAGLSHL